MFDSEISPNLWTVCNASCVHAEICLTNYGFDLGCNITKGGEYDYLKLICFRLNGYDDVKYKKKTTSYISTVDTSLSCGICRAYIESIIIEYVLTL